MSVAARPAPAGKKKPASASPSRPGAKGGGGRARAASGRKPGGPTRPTRAAIPVAAGAVWALALLGAVAASAVLTALVLVPAAAIATASGLRAAGRRSRSRRSRSRARTRRPPMDLTVALAATVVVPLIALAGPIAALAALGLAGGALAGVVLASGYSASARPLRAVGSRLVASLAPVVVVTCVVVARGQGSTLALALVGATLAYDAGSFLMGNARTPLGGPVGVAFGVASVAVVAIFVAAVMNPPFSGSRPWVIFAAVAVAAPLGVRLCQVVAGEERVPALRRLDSLSLAAPVWVLAATLLLHR